MLPVERTLISSAKVFFSTALIVQCTPQKLLGGKSRILHNAATLDEIQ